MEENTQQRERLDMQSESLKLQNLLLFQIIT